MQEEDKIHEKEITNENIEVDILGSIEFDLTEAIKDLIWHMKSIKNDVDIIKNDLNIKKP